MTGALRGHHAPYQLVFVVVFLGAFAQSLALGLVLPVLPQIQRELDTDQATASWVLTAYLLCAAVATPIAGRVGDAFGKTRTWAISLILMAFGSLLAAIAPSIGVLIGARSVQGLGYAVIPLSFAIAKDHLPPDKVRDATAVLSALQAVGFAGALIIAGPIVQAWGLGWLFGIQALVAIAMTIATLVVIPESPHRSRVPIPVLPTLLLSGWLISLLLGVNRAPEFGWSSPRILGLLIGSAAFFVGWVIAETVTATPLIDLRQMRDRAVWSIHLVAFMAGAATYASIAAIPAFYQTPRDQGYGFGVSTTDVGYLVSLAPVVSFFLGLFAARIAARFGMRLTLFSGCLVASAALLAIVLVHDHLAQVFAAATISFVAINMVFANLPNAVFDSVPATSAGTAIGMNTNIRVLGGSVGTAVMTTIITSAPQESGYPTEQAYMWGFTFLSVCALLAAFGSMLVPHAPRSSGRTAPHDVDQDLRFPPGV